MSEHKCFTDVERKRIIELVNGVIVESVVLMFILVAGLWVYLFMTSGFSLGNYAIATGVSIVATIVAVKEWNLRIKP